MPLLEIKNLEAGYDGVQVLRGINLSIGEKDLAAIVGPNGSGKSTTLKCIFGLLKPTKGTILFKGGHMERKSPDQIVKLGISYVPQGRRVFPTLTVQENLEMGGYILGKGLIRERVNEVYAYFPELKERVGQRATFLSGGQQQMLAIGRALILKPDLLLLDEPSLGLAPKIMVEIFRRIKEINKLGTTVILVEQNAHMALEIATKAYVLETGRIALHDGLELTKRKGVKELYLGH